MERVCERCGSGPRWIPKGTAEAPWPHQEGLDYCAKCYRDRCADCMSQGCCGEVPAKSGRAEDYAEETA